MGVTRPARVGMYGGAFDPPHDAHRVLARTAIRALALDVLHVVPTGAAWHKARALSAAADRLALCELAFGAIEKAQVDARELHRAGPSYTFDTLTELHAEDPAAELYLVIGTDQAEVFRTWHRAADILALARIAIAVRGEPAPWSAHFDPRNPLPGMTVDASRVTLLNMPPMPHSATEVRRRVAARESITDWTPAAVAAYIEAHHLYQITE